MHQIHAVQRRLILNESKTSCVDPIQRKICLPQQFAKHLWGLILHKSRQRQMDPIVHSAVKDLQHLACKNEVKILKKRLEANLMRWKPKVQTQAHIYPTISNG